jgi:hypothetical protein
MQEINLKNKARVMGDTVLEYKFEPIPLDPTSDECSFERHDVRVDVKRVNAIGKYHIYYKTKLQKSKKYHGSTKTFEDTVIAVERLFNGHHKAACRKVEQREAKKIDGQEFLKKLKVGTVLVSSWGYSMTIVDYYKVKQIKGNKITIVELNNVYPNNDNGSLSGSKVIAGDQECGEPKTYMIRGGQSLKISSSQYAYIWDGTPNYENRND